MNSSLFINMFLLRFISNIFVTIKNPIYIKIVSIILDSFISIDNVKFWQYIG